MAPPPPRDEEAATATTGASNNNNNNSNAVRADDSAAANTSVSWKSYDPDDLTVGERYGLCISAVVPRPVAVITSLSSPSSPGDDDGILNCAPFSYTSIQSHDPPIVTHGLCLSRGGKKKDTLNNIESTGEWVYNVLTTNYLSQANECSATLPPDQDEASHVGLDVVASDVVKCPRLKSAKVAMECKLYDKKEVYNDDGVHTTTIVMGRVVKFHVDERVLDLGDDGGRGKSGEGSPKVDLRALDAVGRAGGVTYWPVGVTSKDEGNVLPLPRPK